MCRRYIATLKRIKDKGQKIKVNFPFVFYLLTFIFMVILGIDPGTTAIGYAILNCAGPTAKILAADTVKITSRDGVSRLRELHSGIKKVVSRWKPEAVAVERLFFAKNQKTALAVAEARGVILLTTALAGLKFYEYTPLEIKRAVTGDGRADKEQIKKMVHLIFPQKDIAGARDDVFDAIAIATCCHQDIRIKEAYKKQTPHLF